MLPTTTGRVVNRKLGGMMETLMHVLTDFPKANNVSCIVKLICVSMYLFHMEYVQDSNICAMCEHAILFKI